MLNHHNGDFQVRIQLGENHPKGVRAAGAYAYRDNLGVCRSTELGRRFGGFNNRVRACCCKQIQYRRRFRRRFGRKFRRGKGFLALRPAV